MTDEIDSIVREAIDQWQIPGLSVALATASGFYAAEGFGLADVENDVPATRHTVYRMASITKPITATAAMQLAERGALDLDVPIQRYVPEFPEKPWPVTARQLLGHLAGIRDWEEGEGRPVTYHPYETEHRRAFLAPFANDDLLHEPGTRFRYSTYGYNLLGCAIENASGTDYLSFVRANIFSPAGMTHASSDDTRAIVPCRARGYVREGDRLRNADFADCSNHIPGGGLCGTVEDVVRFGLALQAGKLLRPETQEEMFTRQWMTDGRGTRYGLGWFVWSHRGEPEVAHGGKYFGVTTMLTVRPVSGIVVGVMANLQGIGSPYLHQLTQRLADAAPAVGSPAIG